MELEKIKKISESMDGEFLNIKSFALGVLIALEAKEAGITSDELFETVFEGK